MDFALSFICQQEIDDLLLSTATLDLFPMLDLPYLVFLIN